MITANMILVTTAKYDSCKYQFSVNIKAYMMVIKEEPTKHLALKVSTLQFFILSGMNQSKKDKIVDTFTSIFNL